AQLPFAAGGRRRKFAAAQVDRRVTAGRKRHHQLLLLHPEDVAARGALDGDPVLGDAGVVELVLRLAFGTTDIHYRAPATFVAMGCDWAAIWPIDDATLGAVPDGGALPSRVDGTLLGADGAV